MAQGVSPFGYWEKAIGPCGVCGITTDGSMYWIRMEPPDVDFIKRYGHIFRIAVDIPLCSNKCASSDEGQRLTAEKGFYSDTTSI